MRIAVTGSSGLIGSELVPVLKHEGHQVLRLVRARPTGRDAAYWNPETGEIDAAALADTEAVVHLAGKNVGERRWSESHKRQVLESRTRGTRLIAETMAGLRGGPRTLVSMSGVHYYGSRGDEILTEDSSPGEGFLASVSHAWEAAADPARAAGIRVVHPRGGLVLSLGGAPLAMQLPLFRLGLGGRFGSGSQWWSWISIDDMVGLLRHAVLTPTVSGPLNATAPEPVTNAEFTRALASALGRPAVLRVPRLGLRLVIGELADELVYASIRVLPERTLASGYVFRHATLEQALRDLLSRTEAA